MKPPRPAILLPLIFLAVFAAHAPSSNRTSWDSRWTIPTALSIVREGNIDLDEYGPLVSKENNYAVVRVDERLYCLYPVGSALAALPFVAATDGAFRLAGSDAFAESVKAGIPERFESAVASALVALTAVMIYLIARLGAAGSGGRCAGPGLGVAGSLAAVLVFAFCTSAWSTASRAMWQHTPVILMLTLAMYMLLRACWPLSLRGRGCRSSLLGRGWPEGPGEGGSPKPWLAGLAGSPLAFAVVCRPTAVIPAVVLGLYVLLAHRRQFPLFVLCAAAIALPWMLLNWSIFHSVLPPYYQPRTFGGGGNLLEGIAGNLVSPSRGLLVYSPVLALSVLGAWLKVRRREFTLLDDCLAAVVVLHLLVVSGLLVGGYWCWWGGHCYGPRFTTDIVPILIYFLLPVLGACRPATGEFSPLSASRRKALIVVVVALCAWSLFANYRGANDRATLRWNRITAAGAPANVDEQPWRLWDWSDPQFWRR